MTKVVDLTNLVHPAKLCLLHQAELANDAAYTASDSWQALFVLCQVILIQAVLADMEVFEKIGGQPQRIKELGCLACYKPEVFHRIVCTIRTRDMAKLRVLGDEYSAQSVRRKFN